MKSPLRLVSVLAGLLCACTASAVPVEPSAADSLDASTGERDASSGTPDDSVIPLLDACSGPDDPMMILDVAHDGPMLEVTVSHSGGCAEHAYQACWNGAIAKSLPPQASLELRHDGHGDACEAELTETLTIDVSSMIEAGSGSVAIRVGDQRIRIEE